MSKNLSGSSEPNLGVDEKMFDNPVYDTALESALRLHKDSSSTK